MKPMNMDRVRPSIVHISAGKTIVLSDLSCFGEDLKDLAALPFCQGGDIYKILN